MLTILFLFINIIISTISGHLDFNILNKIRLRKIWNFPEHNWRIVRSVINKLHLIFAKNMRSFLDLSLVNWSNFVSLTDICLAKSHFQYFYTIDLEKMRKSLFNIQTYTSTLCKLLCCRYNIISHVPF